MKGATESTPRWITAVRPNEDHPTVDRLSGLFSTYTVGPAELYAVSSSTTFFGIVRCTLQYSPPPRLFHLSL